MKAKNIFLGIFVAAIAMAGCDKIEHPLIPKAVNSSLPSTPPNYTDSSAASGAYDYTKYKVLLEDCMGDLCPNCPAASAIADTLASPHGGYAHYNQIVLLEDNMGSLALPDYPYLGFPGVPTNAFEPDYVCLADSSWCVLFNLYSQPYPLGLINRIGFDTNMSFGDGPTWQSTITGIINNNPNASVNIFIRDSCWTTTNPRLVAATFQITFKTAFPSANNYSLETLIIEDHVIGWQKDNRTLFGYDSTFDRRYLVRGAFGNNQGGLALGVPIPTTASSVVNGTWSTFQTYDFTNGEYGKATHWNMANCYIVAFVFNQATQEVVQAEMIKVE